METILEKPRELPEDFTVYRKSLDFPALKELVSNDKLRYEGPIRIQYGETTVFGRALVCYCYGQQYLSITVRTTDVSGDSGGLQSLHVQEDEFGHQFVGMPTRFKPREARTPFSSDEFFQSFSEVCHCLFDGVFDRPSPRDGIVIITGGTGSGKSAIARGLIHLYLQKLMVDAPSRNPHFITCEDPVEKFFYDEPAQARASCAIDYTPRQKNPEADMKELRQALMQDALRQTPSLCFVGETRSGEDWRTLFEFATTGHLVVTTSHAGSLVEAMRKLMGHLSVNTSDQRSSMTSKLLALVHLRTDVVTVGSCARPQKKITLPAMWRNMGGGANSFVSDGLAALLPRLKSAEINPPSCLGRSHFAECIGALIMNRKGVSQPSDELWKEAGPAARKRALSWDLEGV
jgi:hypothetical protein